jgi:hypothetical protein
MESYVFVHNFGPSISVILISESGFQAGPIFNIDCKAFLDQNCCSSRSQCHPVEGKTKIKALLQTMHETSNYLVKLLAFLNTHQQNRPLLPF